MGEDMGCIGLLVTVAEESVGVALLDMGERGEQVAARPLVNARAAFPVEAVGEGDPDAVGTLVPNFGDAGIGGETVEGAEAGAVFRVHGCIRLMVTGQGSEGRDPTAGGREGNAVEHQRGALLAHHLDVLAPDGAEEPEVGDERLRGTAVDGLGLALARGGEVAAVEVEAGEAVAEGGVEADVG